MLIQSRPLCQICSRSRASRQSQQSPVLCVCVCERERDRERDGSSTWRDGNRIKTLKTLSWQVAKEASRPHRAVCCSVLQCDVEWRRRLVAHNLWCDAVWCSLHQCVAEWHCRILAHILRCVAVLQCCSVAVSCGVAKKASRPYLAVYSSVQQCIAVYCSVLQCAAVCNKCCRVAK